MVLGQLLGIVCLQPEASVAVAARRQVSARSQLRAVRRRHWPMHPGKHNQRINKGQQWTTVDPTMKNEKHEFTNTKRSHIVHKCSKSDRSSQGTRSSNQMHGKYPPKEDHLHQCLPGEQRSKLRAIASNDSNIFQYIPIY